MAKKIGGSGSKAIVIERPDDPRACMKAFFEGERERGRGNAAQVSVTVGQDGDHARQPVDAQEVDGERKKEADTEDPEDVSDLNGLLLPRGALPLDVELFSVSYSRALLAGWVKQGSPCCAAASVAGAWNALTRRPRGHERALSSESVLKVMRVVLEDQIASMTVRFERLLGEIIEPLLQAIQAELICEGRHPGPKSTKVKGPHLLRLARSVTFRERENPDHSPTFDRLWELYEAEREEVCQHEVAVASEGEICEVRSCWNESATRSELLENTRLEDKGSDEEEAEGEKELKQLDEEEGESGGTPAGEAKVAGFRASREPGICRRERCPVSGEVNWAKYTSGTISTAGGRGRGGAIRWRWKKDLVDLVKRTGGLDKLSESSPSTVAFGNLGVITTVRYLDSDIADPDNAQVTADLFMGKGRARSARLPVPLSDQDSGEQISEQWAALRQAFLVEGQVLIFHLTNHYALIFALREWRSTFSPKVGHNDASTGAPRSEKAALPAPDEGTDTDTQSAYGESGPPNTRQYVGYAEGGWTRQILTARKGQRPTSWIDFEEARGIMLGWDGYKILVTTRRRTREAATAAASINSTAPV